ncbi:HNH endonuclease [Brevundimonas sp.]|uniref:HNH endonuclease n=1 Tax=Brevundimonas sp. TaxID=1871086 RepID=UPI0035AF6837
MIRLNRPDAPPVLSPVFVAEGVARFALDGSAVWNVDEIKRALSELSSGKCAYCEVRLGEGPAYLEVEHFYAKGHYPGRVLAWENLLPACRRCNAKKGDWDVAPAGQMMVDPTIMAPPIHIQLDEAYRPLGRTPVGEITILEIGLDDIDRLGVKRYKIGEAFKRKLEDLLDRYVSLPVNASLHRRRGVVRAVRDAVAKAGSDAPFSAVIATVMTRSPAYAALKAAMEAAGDWSAELRAADDIATAASLT